MRLAKTGWIRWFTWNCAKNWNLTIRTNGISTTQNLCKKMRHKVFPWDFEIQTNNLISARRPDLEIINKKKRTCRIVGFAVPDDLMAKLKRNEKISTLNLLGNWKNCGCDGDTNCNWCSWYSHQRIGTGIGGLRNTRTSGDHPNYSIIKIGQNTEKSPGDLKRLAITQTLLRNHQLTLVWKTRKGVFPARRPDLIIINNKKRESAKL